MTLTVNKESTTLSRNQVVATKQDLLLAGKTKFSASRLLAWVLRLKAAEKEERSCLKKLGC